MFKFARQQKIFQINRIEIGGQPGQLPTVLIGSIFYSGHNIVKNSKMGVFDKEKAEALLLKEEESSLRTGNPWMIDINGEYPEAMVRYIEFIAEVTNSPFLIDSPNAKVSLAALKYVEAAGLEDRAVYNSINPTTTPDEIAALKDVGIKSAIVLAFNAKMPTVSGRLEILNSLLKLSKEAGIEQPLIDVSVLDIPDPGPVSKAIYLVKEGFGFPAGGGLHNALARWMDYKTLDSTMYLTANVVVHTMPITMGADFLLYGPVGKASEIFLACALADAYVAYAMRQQYRIKPLTRKHPLFNIFRPENVKRSHYNRST